MKLWYRNYCSRAETPQRGHELCACNADSKQGEPLWVSVSRLIHNCSEDTFFTDRMVAEDNEITITVDSVLQIQKHSYF